MRCNVYIWSNHHNLQRRSRWIGEKNGPHEDVRPGTNETFSSSSRQRRGAARTRSHHPPQTAINNNVYIAGHSMIVTSTPGQVSYGGWCTVLTKVHHLNRRLLFTIGHRCDTWWIRWDDGNKMNRMDDVMWCGPVHWRSCCEISRSNNTGGITMTTGMSFDMPAVEKGRGSLNHQESIQKMADVLMYKRTA